LSVLIILMVQTKLFSDLYLTKFLDTSTKTIFLFCVGTDVKRFSCVGMRITDSSRLHCAAQIALDRLFAAREILNISGSGRSPYGSSRGLTQVLRRSTFVRVDKRVRKVKIYSVALRSSLSSNGT